MSNTGFSHLFINLAIGGGSGSSYIGSFDTYADLIAYDVGANTAPDGAWASIENDTGTFIGYLQGVAGSHQAGKSA